MAWSAPRTWSVGEVVTAAIMNTHVRDNLNYLKGAAGAVQIDNEITSLLAAGGSVNAQGTNNGSFARLKLVAKRTSGTTVDWRLLANGLSDAGELAFYDANASAERARFDNAGNFGIGTVAPQGKLHAVGTGGGFMFLSVNAVDGTLQTIAAAGTVASTAYFLAVLDYANTGGASAVSGQPLKINVGASNTYTNGDTITIAVTAGGAITIQRTTGTASTHQVGMLVLSR